MAALKERLIYIDRLKGITILLVVFGHFIESNVANYEHNRLFSFIYSFHMPLFMFISGYVTYKTTSDKIFNNYGGFLQKKALGLLVPFFAWPLLVHRFFFTREHDNNLLEQFFALMKRPGGGLWYLWELFFLVVIYSLFLMLSKKFNAKNNVIKDLVLCIPILAVLMGFKVLHIVDYVESFIFYYVFFNIGVFLAKYDFIKNIIMNKKVFTSFLIVFIVLSGYYDFSSKSSLNQVYKIIISISAICSIYYIVINVKINEKIDKYLLLWGKNSIVIYTTHFVIVQIFIINKIIPDVSNSLLIFIALFFSVIVTIACMAIYKVVQLSPLLNLLLYGNQAILNKKKPLGNERIIGDIAVQ